MDKKAFIQYLAAYTTQNKLEKMEKVLATRTRHITLVLEDLFQPHNASAVLRSAECFGLQDVHIVEQRNSFRATQGVAMGAAKWLDLNYYNSITECVATLKERGYKIAATTLHPNAIPLQQLPLDNKIALVFGTEHTGLTSKALDSADMYVTIPMYGFTQSFNVSVSAGLCLYQLTDSLRKSSLPWQLTDQEKEAIMLTWLGKTIRGYKGLCKLWDEKEITL